MSLPIMNESTLELKNVWIALVSTSWIPKIAMRLILIVATPLYALAGPRPKQPSKVSSVRVCLTEQPPKRTSRFGSRELPPHFRASKDQTKIRARKASFNLSNNWAAVKIPATFKGNGETA